MLSIVITQLLLWINFKIETIKSISSAWLCALKKVNWIINEFKINISKKKIDK